MNTMNEIDIRKIYSDSNRMYMARIELTTRCNFKCKHCFIEDYSKKGFSTAEMFKLLDNLRQFGVYIVEFTGGEIFTRPDIMEILRYARKLKFNVALLTNLSLVTDDMIAELDAMSIEGISTTLFSMSDEINDKITGRSHSASTVINTLMKLKKTKMSVEVKTVLMQENAGEYQAIQKFCEGNGFTYLATEGIFPSMSGDTAPRKLTMTYSQLKDCIYPLDLIRFNGLYKEEKLADKPICCELHYSLFIGADGECYPCTLWFEKLGNVRDYNYDISSIWNHPLLEHVRKLTWKDLPKCAECENSSYCIRCTGIVSAVKGNMMMEDPFSCRTANARSEVDLTCDCKYFQG